MFNATHLSMINEISSRDPQFLATIQQRLQQEADAVMAHATQLKEAATFTGSIETPAVVTPAVKPVVAKTVKRGRPRGSVNSEGQNKMEAVRSVLRAHPGLQLKELSEKLQKAGTPIENGMLSSYLYHLVSNKEIKKSGKRNSYTYTLRGRK